LRSSLIKTDRSSARNNAKVSNVIDTQISVDAGNGYLKIAYAGRLVCVPSFIRPLDSWQDAEGGDGTVVLELNGKRWIVGKGAGQLNGQLLFEAGKSENYHLMVLAAVVLAGVPTSCPVLNVRCLVPNKSADEWQGIGDKLKGVTEFVANGQKYRPQFRDVALFSEGEPIWKYIKAQGLLPAEFAEDRVAVVDLGSGDVTAYLFTLTGVIDWERSVQVPGMKWLAGQVAAAISRKPGMSFQADRGVILDLIRKGVYTYRIGGSEVPFDEEFSLLSDRWIKKLGQSLVEEIWADIANEIGMVYIVGGAANLADPLVRASGGRFEVFTVDGVEPQLISVFSMSKV
jgi:hypothetical protein